MEKYEYNKALEEAVWRILVRSREALSPGEINNLLAELKFQVTLAHVIAILQEMHAKQFVDVDLLPLAQGGKKYRAKSTVSGITRQAN